MPLSKSKRFEILKRDSFTCWYCGRKSPEAVLHVDHLFPVSMGGGNEEFNLLTACEECNFGKSALVIYHFGIRYHSLVFLSEVAAQLRPSIPEASTSVSELCDVVFGISHYRNGVDAQQRMVDSVCSLYHASDDASLDGDSRTKFGLLADVVTRSLDYAIQCSIRGGWEWQESIQ